LTVPAERISPLIAIVEDDAGMQRALARLLSAEGFELALYDCAEAFIDAPPSRAPLCLIVDVQLPGMSGLELQHRLREEGSHLPVIVTTGHHEEAIRNRAEAEGCTAFFWKPLPSDTLLTTLTSIAGPSQF
jgi:FixJ family two-component response regulator